MQSIYSVPRTLRRRFQRSSSHLSPLPKSQAWKALTRLNRPTRNTRWCRYRQTSPVTNRQHLRRPLLRCPSKSLPPPKAAAPPPVLPIRPASPLQEHVVSLWAMFSRPSRHPEGSAKVRGMQKREVTGCRRAGSDRRSVESRRVAFDLRALRGPRGVSAGSRAPSSPRRPRPRRRSRSR